MTLFISVKTKKSKMRFTTLCLVLAIAVVRSMAAMPATCAGNIAPAPDGTCQKGSGPGCSQDTALSPMLSCPSSTTDCDPSNAWPSDAGPVKRIKYKFCQPCVGKDCARDGGAIAACCTDECGSLPNINACSNYPGKGATSRCTWIQVGRQGSCLAYEKVCMLHSSDPRMCKTLPMCVVEGAKCVYADPGRNLCPGAGGVTTQDIEEACGPATPGYFVAIMVLAGIAFAFAIGMIVTVIVRKKMKDAEEEKKKAAEQRK